MPKARKRGSPYPKVGNFPKAKAPTSNTAKGGFKRVGDFEKVGNDPSLGRSRKAGR